MYSYRRQDCAQVYVIIWCWFSTSQSKSDSGSKKWWNSFLYTITV